MTIEQAIVKLDFLADTGLAQEISRAERSTLATMRETAVDLSSGGYSQDLLTAMGHPYGRGGTRPAIPYGDAAVVNAQSGEFRAGWRELLPSFSGDQIGSQLRNDSEHADFMHGTRRMIRRPIEDRVESRTRAIRRRNLAQALRKAIP